MAQPNKVDENINYCPCKKVLTNINYTSCRFEACPVHNAAKGPSQPSVRLAWKCLLTARKDGHLFKFIIQIKLKVMSDIIEQEQFPAIEAEFLPEITPTEVKQLPATQGSFGNKENFEHAQRVAKMLSASDLVPAQFKGNIANTMIALEMANRIGANPLMVMQNLYIVHGKPSWSSTFIISAINSSGKFSPLRFEVSGEGDEYGCIAWAYDLKLQEKLEGPRVTIGMAKKEGWYSKNGSKWQTMPELMMRYRAAAFFGRLYAPEIMMGMQTAEEVKDVEITTITEEQKKQQLSNALNRFK